MTRVLLGSLAAVAAIALTLSAQEPGKPKADPPKEPKVDTLAEQIQRYGKNHRRVCGAKLTVSKAELVSVDKVGEVVRVHWEIDYTGPRPPLTIYKPTMLMGPKDRTCLGFHYEDGRVDVGRLTYMCNPQAKGVFGITKEEFVTAEKGQNSVSGVLDVPSSTDEHVIPIQQCKRPFYVQLKHNPQERGPQYDLDAWAGELVSNVIEVTEPKK
jgi:hypothetical protein